MGRAPSVGWCHGRLRPMSEVLTKTPGYPESSVVSLCRVPDPFDVEGELEPPSGGATDRLDHLFGLLHEARRRASRVEARVDKAAG